MARILSPLVVALAMLLAAEAPRLGAQTINPPAGQTEAEEGPRRVVLRFLTEGDFPPFNYLDEEGVLSGFNVDLARAICLEMGAACDIQVRAWDELIPALGRNEADAVIAAHVVTARNLARVDFTDRYFHTPGRFAGRKGAPKLDITPAGLDGKRVAVARGTSHEAYLTTFFRFSNIKVYDSIELARDALLQAQVDLVFDDGISLVFWLAGTVSKECCEFRGGPFLEPKYFGDGIAMAVPKNDPQLKAFLNRALKRVRASGRFEELVQRYFPFRIY
jgi:polar amino acid transport system substrate-binding protein